MIALKGKVTWVGRATCWDGLKVGPRSFIGKQTHREKQQEIGQERRAAQGRETYFFEQKNQMVMGPC